MNGLPYSSRAEWLELRRGGIGGTDAAALLGASRWSTPYDVWESKMLPSVDRAPSVRMEWGRRLEDVIAEAVADETGLRLRRSNRILLHPEYPFIRGSVDRLAKGRVIEIKNARAGDDFVKVEDIASTPPELRVPRDYYVQGQHYAAVTGADEILFGVLVGGNDLRVIPVPADRAFIDDLVEYEVDWWTRYVVPGEPPPLVADDRAKLPRLYPHGAGEKVATPEVDLLVKRLLAARAKEDAAHKIREGLEVAIVEYLGEASDLVSGVAKVTYRESTTNRVGWQDVARAYRGMAEELADLLDVDPMTGHVRLVDPHRPVSRTTLPYLPGIPATYGPGPDGIEALFTETKTSRRFLLDRKGKK